VLQENPGKSPAKKLDCHFWLVIIPYSILHRKPAEMPVAACDGCHLDDPPLIGRLSFEFSAERRRVRGLGARLSTYDERLIS